MFLLLIKLTYRGLKPCFVDIVGCKAVTMKKNDDVKSIESLLVPVCRVPDNIPCFKINRNKARAT